MVDKQESRGKKGSMGLERAWGFGMSLMLENWLFFPAIESGADYIIMLLFGVRSHQRKHKESRLLVASRV